MAFPDFFFVTIFLVAFFDLEDFLDVVILRVLSEVKVEVRPDGSRGLGRFRARVRAFFRLVGRRFVARLGHLLSLPDCFEPFVRHLPALVFAVGIKFRLTPQRIIGRRNGGQLWR